MNARQLRRISIMNRIKNAIRAASITSNVLIEKSYVALLCVETGLSLRTLTEYIDLLVDSGFCKREEGKLFMEAK